jgi:hypothetical protein
MGPGHRSNVPGASPGASLGASFAAERVVEDPTLPNWLKDKSLTR